MSNSAANTALPASFEAALQELESIVRGMESGDAGIERSLADYERGVRLLRHLQDTLSAAEQTVQALQDGVLTDLSAAGTDAPDR